MLIFMNYYLETKIHISKYISRIYVFRRAGDYEGACVTGKEINFASFVWHSLSQTTVLQIEITRYNSVIFLVLQSMVTTIVLQPGIVNKYLR